MIDLLEKKFNLKEYLDEKLGYKYSNNEELTERFGVILGYFILWCIVLWGVINITIFFIVVWMFVVVELVHSIYVI